MSVLDIAARVFRDWNTYAVPASGAHDPVKAEIRALFAQIVTLIGSDDIPAELAEDIATIAGQIESVQTNANLSVAARDAAIVAAAAALAERLLSQAARTAAQAAQGEAEEARDAALAYAELTGPFVFFATKAEADAALAGLPANQLVQVWADETAEDTRTVYKKVSGVYVLQATLDYLAKDAGNLTEAEGVEFRAGAMVGRLQEFDWREDGARPDRTGAQNRESLDTAAARAADFGPRGVVTLGGGEPYLLERWQPGFQNLVIDGNGATIVQSAPVDAASLAIGGVYTALGAIIVGPNGSGLRVMNTLIGQDAAVAALPLVGGGTTYMGTVCVRRANNVRFEAVEITSDVGPGVIWRGGNGGALTGILNTCRAVVHAGFENDPFAGDSGSADTSIIYTPLNFFADLTLSGSPTDETAVVHFHMTGGNDWNIDLRVENITRTDVRLFRGYCNDYGLYLSDGVTHDTSLRGSLRMRGHGEAKDAVTIEGRSTVPELDTTLYDCSDVELDVVTRVTGDGTSATGQGIRLANASGVHGDCHIVSDSSPILVEGVSDRGLTGEYRCMIAGVSNMTLYTAPGASLGRMLLPRLVSTGTGDEHLERFGLATYGAKHYTSEGRVELIGNSTVPGARLLETAEMRGPTDLGNITCDVVGSGYQASYLVAINSGTHDVSIESIAPIDTTGSGVKTAGMAINSAGHVEAKVIGMPVITSHIGSSTFYGHLLSEISTVDAYENEVGGDHTLDCVIESTTTRRAGVVRGGVVRLGPMGRWKAMSGSFASSPLTITGGVVEFCAPAGAFEYTGSAAPISFSGGDVRGMLGAYANLNGYAPWTDANRIAAANTLAGTWFINSSDSYQINISTGADWNLNGSGT